MNPSQCPVSEALFAQAAHAGGWPKLGWCTDEQADEVFTCYDEDVVH